MKITAQTGDVSDTRNTERYGVKENILVYNETTFADIIDISEIGLSCRFLINLQDENRSITSIDLLNSSERLHVRNISCEQIHYRDELISSTFPSTALRTCGIKFIQLDESTLKQIANFIEHSKLPVK